ncbi:MAG: GSCFA domain-containing protein [Spirochaetota bacterium]
MKSIFSKNIVNTFNIPDELKETSKIYTRSLNYPMEEIIEHFNGHKFITKDTKIISIGSCFSQSISDWLLKKGYSCQSNIWGVVYNPQSVSQIIDYSVNTSYWTPTEKFWVINDRYYDPYRKSSDHSGPVDLGNSEYQAEENLKQHYQNSRDAFKDSNLLLFNLDLTEVWRNRTDKKAFYATPRPQIFTTNNHEFHVLSYEEVYNSVKNSIMTLRQINPEIAILLNVEPIPLSISYQCDLGPFVANQFAKSVLHAVAIRITQEIEYSFYLPLYEISRCNPSKIYSDDGRHISTQGISLFMKAFEELYVI